LVALISVAGAAIGLRLGVGLNVSRSAPRGIYRTVGEAPLAEPLVVACPPGAVTRLGRERGYLGRGDCPGRTQPRGGLDGRGGASPLESDLAAVYVEEVAGPAERLVRLCAPARSVEAGGSRRRRRSSGTAGSTSLRRKAEPSPPRWASRCSSGPSPARPSSLPSAARSTWTGIGLVAARMARQAYDLSLTRYDAARPRRRHGRANQPRLTRDPPRSALSHAPSPAAGT